MYLDSKRLFLDDPMPDGVSMAFCDMLDIVCNGFHLYGEIYLPDGSYPGKRPCVCMFHGFPGSAVNDDLAQALRRMGCVVIRLFQRGAWGSEGYYSFTNNIQDAAVIARWATEKGADRYPIDTRRVFLLGHSVGGMTALNAARTLPQALGVMLLAPMDFGYLFSTGQANRAWELLPHGFGILRQEKERAWEEDLLLHWKDYSFISAADDLKTRNLLFIGAELDDIAPPQEMVVPLWDKLQELPAGTAHRDFSVITANHTFCSARFELSRQVGDWIVKVCGEPE